MKSSFKDADQESVPAPEQESKTATALVPADQSSGGSVVPAGFFSNDGMEGEFSKDDLKIPGLNLVQSVGPLSGEMGFTPGKFVYNMETDIGSDIEFTICKMRKFYSESLEYGSEERPQFFQSMDDARRQGFLPIQDKYNKGKDADDFRYVKPVLSVDVLLKGKPEFTTFPMDFNGVPFAKARWTIQNVAYSRVGKQLVSDTQLALRSGLNTRFYKGTAKREKIGQNFVFVPKATIAGKNDDAFIAWMIEMGL